MLFSLPLVHEVLADDFQVIRIRVLQSLPMFPPWMNPTRYPWGFVVVQVIAFPPDVPLLGISCLHGHCDQLSTFPPSSSFRRPPRRGCSVIPQRRPSGNKSLDLLLEGEAFLDVVRVVAMVLAILDTARHRVGLHVRERREGQLSTRPHGRHYGVYSSRGRPRAHSIVLFLLPLLCDHSRVHDLGVGSVIELLRGQELSARQGFLVRGGVDSCGAPSSLLHGKGLLGTLPPRLGHQPHARLGLPSPTEL
ncbi:unnamed protein product [Cuscuta campestris]|uniref:Uncharacterized protein n=1 Tax=Cuscuta campestris TaxID=132261 RepID=A0A484MMK9_9ASTE|nr:unnamed protein product [Cuscuta campestris]